MGGGGLIAGIAAYVKYLRPEIRVIGVEPDDSNCLQQAMAAGERVVLPRVGLFADGVAVAQIGHHTFEICRRYVDEVITVSSDEICAAIKDIYDDTRSITEPSGALGVAGIKKYAERAGSGGQVLVAIDSGANINFDRLRHVAERAELGEQREAIIAVTIPERPGSFRASAKPWAGGRSPNSTTATTPAKRPISSLASRPIPSAIRARRCCRGCATKVFRCWT